MPPYTPQLAQLVKAPPSGSEWLHEIKYDGYRIGCRMDGGHVKLLSRNGKDWTDAFPEIVRAARALRVRSALFDGELCYVMPDGRTSFQQLQNAFSGGSRDALVYFVFDLLYLNGRSLLGEPLEERKRLLKPLVLHDARFQFAEHLDADGPEAFREACRLGLEGIVSKQRDQPYRSGKRVGWLKTKCVQRQEFVIGGFTDPEGSRQGIGALLVGHYEGDRLAFAGKVGTGFTTKSARDLRIELNAIEVRECPFDPRPAGWLGRNAHWVKPTLVGEVVFTEWTNENKIRHPSFQGLRRDKDPKSVVRENAQLPTARHADKATVRGVRISNPDRVMYDEPRLTKLEIVQYYDRIADAMMPHVDGRPLTLVRCGNGITGDCIYMKHSKVWAPAALTRVKIREKRKIGDYLVIESPEAIVSLAQMDVLEIHTWNTRARKVEYPDRIVLDLDPGPDVTWPEVVESARLVRKMLHGLDLESFVKTTGGRGLHVVIPLDPVRTWEECLEFARSMAATLVEHDPKLYTMNFGKQGREGQILVDYLRNNRTNTSIAAFSTRARTGAPVSTPISWTELSPKLDPSRFTVETVPDRLRKMKRDPWADYFTMRQRLPRR
jgi:bifunctional non-homologous end joining protein LigD